MVRILVLLALLLAAAPLEAANLYVNPNDGDCDNTRVKANVTAALPWCHVGRAVWGSMTRTSPNAGEASTAGDTVYVTPGTYSTNQFDGGGNGGITLTYNPANSGTSGNPITFIADGGDVVLTWTDTVNGVGNMFGAMSRNYIVWKGQNGGRWVVDEVNALSNGWTVLIFDANHITIDGCVLSGDPDRFDQFDNHYGIRLVETTFVTLRNCHVSEMFNLASGADNGAGIGVYLSNNYLIEHNETTNNGTGIFIKAPLHDGNSAFLGPGTIRYNYTHNNTEYNLTVHRSPLTGTDYLLVYQNISVGGGSGLNLHLFDGDGPANTKVINNLFYLPSQFAAIAMNGGTTMIANAGNEFKNNIVVANDDWAWWAEAPDAQFTAAKLYPNRNAYNGVGSVFFQNGTGDHNYAEWQALGGGTYDANSITSEVSFVNAAGGNFHLEDNEQAALTLGRVVYGIGGSDGATIPAGPYITGTEVIGLDLDGDPPATTIPLPRGLKGDELAALLEVRP